MKVTIVLDEFTPEMNTIINGVPRMLFKISKNIAFEIVREAKLQLYPGHGYKIGFLQSGIDARQRGKEFHVGPIAKYGKKIENMYGYMRIGVLRASVRFENIANATAAECLEGL